MANYSYVSNGPFFGAGFAPSHFFPQVARRPTDVADGIGIVIWLSARSGVIDAGRLGLVSFEIKDFCDQAVSDFSAVLRNGFILKFQAVICNQHSAQKNVKWSATFVSPLLSGDRLKNGPFLELMVGTLDSSLDLQADGDDPTGKQENYSVAVERRALKYILSVFQTLSLPKLPLSTLHCYISNCGEQDIYHYIGTSSAKRRQFFEKRTHVFHFRPGDDVQLVPPPLYHAILLLAQQLLARGGAAPLQELFEVYLSCPDIPLEARDVIGEGKNKFLRFLEQHPWIFVVFPSKVFVALRRKIVDFNYADIWQVSGLYDMVDSLPDWMLEITGGSNSRTGSGQSSPACSSSNGSGGGGRSSVMGPESGLVGIPHTNNLLMPSSVVSAAATRPPSHLLHQQHAQYQHHHQQHNNNNNKSLQNNNGAFPAVDDSFVQAAASMFTSLVNTKDVESFPLDNGYATSSAAEGPFTFGFNIATSDINRLVNAECAFGGGWFAPQKPDGRSSSSAISSAFTTSSSSRCSPEFSQHHLHSISTPQHPKLQPVGSTASLRVLSSPQNDGSPASACSGTDRCMSAREGGTSSCRCGALASSSSASTSPFETESRHSSPPTEDVITTTSQHHRNSNSIPTAVVIIRRVTADGRILSDTVLVDNATQTDDTQATEPESKCKNCLSPMDKQNLF